MDIDTAAVISGSDTAFQEEEDSDTNEDEEYNDHDHDSISFQDDCEKTLKSQDSRLNFKSLYDPNQDDEDEAYVYKHLRSGVEESVRVASSQSASSMRNASNTIENSKSLQYTLQTMLKPRQSDAILSCPCCFQIVCMDCQRHERYLNQYRAMFVMNISVDWNHIVYTSQPEEDFNVESRGKLKKGTFLEKDHFHHDEEEDDSNDELEDGEKGDRGTSSSSPTHQRRSQNKGEQQVVVQNESDHVHYYSVHCLQCNTEVAALGMHDEVYHFFGCLVSG